eukprot:jgi/Mesvir1/17856/Mv12939-RA.1
MDGFDQGDGGYAEVPPQRSENFQEESPEEFQEIAGFQSAFDSNGGFPQQPAEQADYSAAGFAEQANGGGSYYQENAVYEEQAPDAYQGDFGASTESANPPSSFSAPAAPPEPDEPNALVEWRAKNEDELIARTAKSRLAHQEILKKAAAERTRMHEERAARIATRKATNREAEALTRSNLEYTQSANVWEGVVGLVNVDAKASQGKKDTGRMRQMFVKLKHAGKAG